jgi:hypothetical protein
MLTRLLMTRKFSYSLALAALVFSGTAAKAANLTPCAPGTLASYQAMTGDCQIGIEIFQGFTFTSSGTGPAPLYSNTDILVTPLTFPDGQSAGFQFSLDPNSPFFAPDLGHFQVLAGSTALYDIQYEFFFNVDPVAGSADLGMDPPFGTDTINQYYCADVSQLNFNGPNGAPNCETFSDFGNFNRPAQVLTVNDTNPPTSWDTGIVELVPLVRNSAFVLTTISLDGTNGASGFDDVRGADFVGTPEPSTIVFAAGGLLALALRKRFW